MGYPDGNALAAELERLGMPAPANVDSIAAGAASEFERLTGWVPFLADSESSTVAFDPPELVPGYILDLGCAFWTVDSVSLDGSALTQSDDYVLRKMSASSPLGYTAIQFKFNPGGKIQSVSVTGRKGLIASIPDDVYQAILGRGVAVAASHSQVSALDASRIKQGPVEMEFGGPKDAKGRIEMLNASFKSCAISWRAV